MLGDIVELTVVVRDLDAAVERFTEVFGLTVHRRGESEEFGFKNAILPTGIGHIELLQPTDPTKPVGRFLEKHGEGVYLVGFECRDILGSVEQLKAHGVRVDHRPGAPPGAAGSVARGRERIPSTPAARARRPAARGERGSR